MRAQPIIGLAGLAVLACASLVSAQPLPLADAESVGMSAERLDRIEDVFEARIEKGELPGAVIMVAREGKLVYQTALGDLDPGRDAPMTEDAIFRIYSMTKPLVSVAAMILVEEGEIDLMDPVSKFLPEFKGLEVSEPDGSGGYKSVAAEREMTVQDLLRHTSGLAYGELTKNDAVKAGYAEAEAYQPDGMAFEARGASPDEQVAGLGETDLANQPGKKWEYSLASDVLGRVVERVSGMRLGDFLDARVFTPLGMEDTGFSVPEGDMDRLAGSFETDPSTGTEIQMIDVSELPMNDSGGAGGVSTAGDYLRFSQMLLDGGALGDARILSPTTVKLMASDHLGDRIEADLTPGELLFGTPGYTFGLGFMVREGAGVASVPGSEGEFMWAGYAGTFFWIDPAEDLTAVMMTQLPGASRASSRRLVKQLVHQSIVESHAAPAPGG